MTPFQTQPYPVSPLAQLLRTYFAVREHRKQQAAEAEDVAHRKTMREAQVREMQQAPLREKYGFYIQTYQQDPRGAFRAAYEDAPEFRELTRQLYGFQAPTTGANVPPPGAGVTSDSIPAIGGGVTSASIPQASPNPFNLPGPPPPAFRTTGEMAQKFGLKLRPGVDPNIAIDTLPRNISPAQLFIDPAEEREKERGDAAARIKQLLSIYKVEQVFADPRLRDPFLRDYQTVYGQPFPTRTTPEMTTRQVPQTVTSTPPVTGTGPGLTRAGLPQTMRTGVTEEQRIPTGKEIEEPILPEQPKRLTLGEFDPRFSNTQYGSLPVPMTDDGNNVNFAALGHAYDRAGIRAPQSEIDKRVAAFGELDRLFAAVQRSNTPAEAKSAGTAYNRYLATIKAQGLTVPHEPIDVPAAVAGVARRTAQPRQPREPRQAPGGLMGLLVLRAQGHMTGNPQIDRLSQQQAEGLSRDPRLKQPNFLEFLMGGDTEGGTAPSPGQTPPPAAVPGSAPSQDAKDALAIYQRTKRPVPQSLWRTFSPAEQEWLRRQGVKVVQ